MHARHADRADLPELLQYCEQFWRSLCFSATVPFCKASSLRTLESMVHDGMLFVAEDDLEIAGMLGGVVSHSFVNESKMTGTELFFWVRPEYRKSGAGQQLLALAEQTAKAYGCVLWTMVAVEHMEAEKVGAMYERAGYTWVERAYAKQL